MTISRTDPLNSFREESRPPRVADIRFPAPEWYPQQADWVSEPATSDNAAYNYPLSLRIRGSFDKEILRRSLEAVTRRHEVLRSIFRADEQGLTQVVMPGIPNSVHDLPAHEDSLSLGQAICLAVEEANRPFDLTGEFLLRATLIRIAAEDHILLLVTHHIVCDDWSAGILLREISQLYSAFSEGQTEPDLLPALSRRYSEFAGNLARRLDGPELRAQAEFWRHQLSGASEFQHLAPDTLRPSTGAVREGGHEVVILPPDVANRVISFGRIERVSTFMILFAALQCHLHRISGENDIGAAACVANRNSTELEHLIAPFSNRVVLRTDFSGSPTFRNILARVRNVALNAYSNQEIPFGTVVEMLAHRSNLDHNPLFQTLVVLQDLPGESWDFGAAKAAWFPLDTGLTRYDLNLWLRFQRDQSLEVDFQYDRGLFQPSIIRKLMEEYCATLSSYVENPEMKLRSSPSPKALQRRKAEPVARTQATSSPLPDGIEIRLARIWSDVLGHEITDGATDFFAAGGDSLQVVEMFIRLRSQFGIELPISTILETPTCGQLAEVLRDLASKNGASSLVKVQPQGTSAPVFCIHNHTGDVLFCRGFHKYMPADHPLYGFQSQALIGKPPHFSVEQMAETYVEELARIQPRGHCYLFGYSFGGLVALEMAQLLRSRGREVVYLGMFNTPAPGSLAGWPLQQFAYLRKRTQLELDKLPRFTPKGKLAHVARKISNFQRLLSRSLVTDAWLFSANFLKRESREKIARALLTLEQINIAAAKEYVPKSAFPGRITFFQAEGVPYIYSIPPEQGWSPFAAEGIEIIDVHNENGRPSDEEFARTVAKSLREQWERNPPPSES